MRCSPMFLLATFAAFAPLASGGKAKATGDVVWWKQLAESKGGFDGAVSSGDWFGHAVAPIGDIDGDGVTDLAVGATLSDDGGDRRGAIWIIFMNPNGTAREEQKISDTEGGFGGVLDNVDWFGTSVAGLGDLDGDGIPDLAVGAALDDDGGTNRGALWILYLNVEGTVKTYRKISSTSGSFFGSLSNNGWFGTSVANLGDLDGDGNPELAVGACRDVNTGSVWILFLNSDATVKSFSKIASHTGGFVGSLGNLGEFGYSVSRLGDLDGDGVNDLAVGARRGCDGGGPPCNLGHAWVFTLTAAGQVKTQQQIASNIGGFGPELDSYAFFGSSVAGLGDLDGDGIVDLAVGSEQDDDGGPLADENANLGALFLFFLNQDGTARTYRKISATQGNFGGKLAPYDLFGQSLANIGDLDGDGVIDLAVGGDYDGESSSLGSVWLLGLSDVMGFGTPIPNKSEVGIAVDVTLSPIGGTPPYVVDLAKGNLPPGIVLLNDGTLQGTPTTKGKYKFNVLLIDDTGMEVVEKVVHRVAAPVKIATASLDSAKHGKAYQGSLKAKGGVPPYSFEDVTDGLPDGIYLDSIDGKLLGQPAEVGTFDVMVRVTDSVGGMATRLFELTVKSTLKITTETLKKGKVGKAHEQSIVAKGGIAGYSFSLLEGALPSGLTLSSGGVISGTPTEAGKFIITVRVTDDSGETAAAKLTLKVS